MQNRNVKLIELGELCKLQGGFAFKSEDYLSSGIPIIRISNIFDNIVKINENTVYVLEKSVLGLEEFKLSEGDLLIAMSGATTGKIGIVKSNILPAYLNQRVGRFVVNPEILDINYLRFFVGQPDYLNKCLTSASGSAIPNLSASSIEKLLIPFPPIAEQKRIAAICAKADRLRRTRRYVLELSDNYLRSVFLEMFGDPVENPKGWDKIIASEIFDIQLGKMLSAKNYTGENLYPYIANINVQWGYVDISKIRKMDFDNREFHKFRLKVGDILVCEGGEAGRTAIWKGELKDCCYQKAIHRLRSKKPIVTPEYFLYFMRQAVSRGEIKKESTLVTITHFTAERFADFLVMLPPLSLQEKFAAIVQKSNRIRAQQREALRQAEHLFQTILHRAFRGEL